MPEGQLGNTPVKAKAVLVDPVSMTIEWMNESAAETVGEARAQPRQAGAIERLVPMADELGLPAALHSVAESGSPHHLQVDLVSTGRGRVAVVISLYRLPGGKVLLLMENAWQAGRREHGRARP